MSGESKLLDTLLIISFYSTHWPENVAFLNHTIPVTILDLHTLLNQACWLSRSIRIFFILLVYYTKNNQYWNSPVSTSGLNKHQNMFNTVEMYYTVYITNLLQSFTFFSQQIESIKKAALRTLRQINFYGHKIVLLFYFLTRSEEEFLIDDVFWCSVNYIQR